MRRLTLTTLESVVGVAAALGTAWLLGQLGDPYSDLRLQIEELVDRAKGAMRR